MIRLRSLSNQMIKNKYIFEITIKIQYTQFLSSNLVSGEGFAGVAVHVQFPPLLIQGQQSRSRETPVIVKLKTNTRLLSSITVYYPKIFTLTSPIYSFCLLTNFKLLLRLSDTIMLPASSTTRELRPRNSRSSPSSFPKKLAVSSFMTYTQSRPLSEL